MSFSDGAARSTKSNELYLSITFYLYRTSAMAEDIICLLDYLGWTADRELNIVGLSLGGMIAQGQLIPDIFAARFMRSKYI